MQRVKFLSASTLPAVYYLRQFPGQRPIWGDCEFCINDTERVADYCVVYDDVAEEQLVECKPGGRILVTAEPPEVRQYDRDFLAQFDCVVAVDRNIQHPNPIFSQQALSWMVGWRFFQTEQGAIKDYDFFRSYDFSTKPNLIAMVASKKTITQGHARRYRFAQALKDYFGDRMDLFGLGIREIDDKWDALATYRYTLSIENSVIPDYWTEKVTDPFLTLTFPFYYGCPNLQQYFPAAAFERIDIENIQQSIDTIESAVENNLYQTRIDDLRRARDLAMNEFNVFPMLVRLVETLEKKSSGGEFVTTKIRPHARFQNTIWKRIKRKVFA